MKRGVRAEENKRGSGAFLPQRERARRKGACLIAAGIKKAQARSPEEPSGQAVEPSEPGIAKKKKQSGLITREEEG